jgi:hypothetical protein
MHAPQRWGRSRYLAFFVVLALHGALLTGLMIAAKTRFLTTPAAPPIELLILPQNVVPTLPPPPTLSDRRKKVAATPLSPPLDALTVVTPNSTSEVAGPIDWSQEAHNAAASISRSAPALHDTIPAPSSTSPFAAPPAHHKGEQIPTADGRWIVYVSDDCYQVSKSITSVTNATNNGMSLQTYCTRHSKKPRGDLFDQLPAYKKLHPDK